MGNFLIKVTRDTQSSSHVVCIMYHVIYIHCFFVVNCITIRLKALQNNGLFSFSILREKRLGFSVVLQSI